MSGSSNKPFARNITIASANNLVPLLRFQMDSNSNRHEQKENVISKHIQDLFTFFCDEKRDYIDLSCLNEEISSMDEALQDILVGNVKYHRNSDIPTKYKMKNNNLRLILPNPTEDKNHRGYLINLQRDNVKSRAANDGRSQEYGMNEQHEEHDKEIMQ